ncbi:MAG: hypothetical protein GF308_21190 [Candidatus Heimdallarchaeota archaeon]|nr:hypothetical protein [Candidatus Heimdallarchaeota archaeon]
MNKKFLLLILQQSKEEPFLELAELKEVMTENLIYKGLKELAQYGINFQPTINGDYQISREQRAQIAILAAQEGLEFEKVIRELSWQEFELLTTFVGDEFGYEALTGLNFSTNERKYQIDVILKRQPYIFLIDCKHLGGTGKKSVLKKAVEEQNLRVKAVIQEIESLEEELQIQSWNQANLIPMIVTWLDEALFFHKRVPIVPFSKLRSFFQNFYLYFEDIKQWSIELTRDKR